MGWWKDSHKERDIEVGDEPLDLLRECLLNFSTSYQDELGRKPRLEELAFSLNATLRMCPELFDDLAENAVTTEFKVKKAGKVRQYVAGDVFAIPLAGKEYAYGRILKQTSAGHLVEIYKVRTKHLLPLDQLSERHKQVLTNKHVNGIVAFARGRWPIIGHEDLAKSFRLPAFFIGSRASGPILVQGDTQRPCDPDEVKGIEPMTMFTPQCIEEHLARNDNDPWPEVIQGMKNTIGYAQEVRDIAEYFGRRPKSARACARFES
jgi:hypothetical protein